MARVLNIPMTACDLDEIRDALLNEWHFACADAGGYSADEKAELVIDRVSGDAGKIMDNLCNTYGYDAVLHMTAKTLFGGK